MDSSNPYRLILDTSSEHYLLGIAKGRQVLASKISLHSNQLSQLLMPSLEALLAEARITLGLIDEIGVGIGPGSYTGTRVGVAIAKSLHFALKRTRLKSFCSLVAFLPSQEGQFACVMPSKTGDFYLLKGTRSATQLVCRSSSLLDKTALLSSLSDADIFVGKPLNELCNHFPTTSWILPTPNLSPILAYLDTPQPQSPATELIYLHQP